MDDKQWFSSLTVGTQNRLRVAGFNSRDKVLASINQDGGVQLKRAAKVDKRGLREIGLLFDLTFCDLPSVPTKAAINKAIKLLSDNGYVVTEQ